MTPSTTAEPSRIVAGVKRAFTPMGPLALLPAAFGYSFDAPEAEASETAQGGAAVVKIRGPLMHHAGYFFDSYDAIMNRVSEALASGPSSLVLAIDSPGGTVGGLFECAANIRAMAAAAKVPVFSYIEGQGCSAAYALACAADVIGCPATAQVGSIGVIDTLVSVADANAKQGVTVKLITSGARKADGNPNAEITPEAEAATQGAVDDLAEMFFAHVAEARGIDAAAIRKLEAGVFLGAEAVRIGLADEVMTFPEMLAATATGQEMKTMATKSGPGAVRASSEENEDALASLRKLAEGDDEDMAKRAKRAIAAFEQDDEEEPKKDGDEEEASAKRAQPLLLARLEKLEGALAERDAKDTEAMVERDIAAGKIATCDRAEYLDLAKTNPALYSRMTKNARVVPVGTVAKGGEARKAALESEGRIDERQLDEADALLVKSMRAAQLSEKSIKQALARRGAEV